MYVLEFMFQIRVICTNNKFAMLCNDSGLLIGGLWKKEFCENFGAILNFPGIPNESKS